MSIPAKLIVKLQGSSGNFSILATVVDKDANPLPAVEIFIFDDLTGNILEKVYTGDRGYCLWKFTFNEMERHLKVVIPSTDLEWKGHLFGPLTPPKDSKT